MTGDWGLYLYIIVQGIKICAWEVFRAQIGHFVCESWGVISSIYLAVYERIHYRPPLVTWITSKKSNLELTVYLLCISE